MVMLTGGGYQTISRNVTQVLVNHVKGLATPTTTLLLQPQKEHITCSSYFDKFLCDSIRNAWFTPTRQIAVLEVVDLPVINI